MWALFNYPVSTLLKEIYWLAFEKQSIESSELKCRIHIFNCMMRGSIFKPPFLFWSENGSILKWKEDLQNRSLSLHKTVYYIQKWGGKTRLKYRIMHIACAWQRAWLSTSMQVLIRVVFNFLQILVIVLTVKLFYIC